MIVMSSALIDSTFAVIHRKHSGSVTHIPTLNIMAVLSTFPVEFYDLNKIMEFLALSTTEQERYLQEF